MLGLGKLVKWKCLSHVLNSIVSRYVKKHCEMVLFLYRNLLNTWRCWIENGWLNSSRRSEIVLLDKMWKFFPSFFFFFWKLRYNHTTSTVRFQCSLLHSRVGGNFKLFPVLGRFLLYVNFAIMELKLWNFHREEWHVAESCVCPGSGIHPCRVLTY